MFQYKTLHDIVFTKSRLFKAKLASSDLCYLCLKTKQIPMIKADLFLRIFESIPGILKRFETLVETLWKALTNGSNNLSTPALKMLREKISS